MIKTLPREIARFIRSRFGELKVSEARYENLLGETDEYYREYPSYLLMYLMIRDRKKRYNVEKILKKRN
jgi:intergrase/recombinase